MSEVSAQREMWVSVGLGMIKTGRLSEKRSLWTWRELATGNLGGRNDCEMSTLTHLL